VLAYLSRRMNNIASVTTFFSLLCALNCVFCFLNLLVLRIMLLAVIFVSLFGEVCTVDCEIVYKRDLDWILFQPKNC